MMTMDVRTGHQVRRYTGAAQYRTATATATATAVAVGRFVPPRDCGRKTGFSNGMAKKGQKFP